MKLKLLAVACMVLIATEARAGIVVGTTPANGLNYHYFTSTGGLATFNIFGADFGGGPNGAQFWDTMITLAVDDGSPLGALTGAIVAQNDDSADPGWDADGSTSTFDSFLTVNLAAGNYILGVGAFFTDEIEFRSGNASTPSVDSDYQLTYDGVQLGGTAVPVPSSVVLFSLGSAIIGVGAWRRNRLNSRKSLCC